MTSDLNSAQQHRVVGDSLQAEFLVEPRLLVVLPILCCCAEYNRWSLHALLDFVLVTSWAHTRAAKTITVMDSASSLG